MPSITVFIALIFAIFAQALDCENYGIVNGSDCLCPTGFGGSTCSQPACGGTIFQGSQRPLAAVSGSAANLTAAGCSCENGWTGTACNVCQTADACKNGLSSLGTLSTTSPTLGSQGNDTMVCNTQARVYASSQMSCKVINPTLQAIFPLSSTLNIMRTLQPGLSPIPNTTSFGAANTAFAQLFYDGVEQFYCSADSCTQNLNSSGAGSADWQCQNLRCTCRPGTTFCGMIGGAINGLGGSLDIECGAVDNSSETATCNFKQATLQSLFGPGGLTLNGCTFGECVRQNAIDGSSANTATDITKSKPLSGGVIAGLAVVGALILLSLLLLALGLRSQRAARRRGVSVERSRASVEWTNLSYTIPGESESVKIPIFGRRKGGATEIYTDKVILDNVTGVVKPGQMMAILGPSGAGKTTLVEILAGRSKSGVISGHFGVIAENADQNSAPRIGFVPQQDILPPMLTVFEALLFAARLRLPETVTEQEKKDRVNALLEKLGISAIKNSRIGDVMGSKNRGISGGEMRRVSIGLELIACPDVLLLDEPTSGLDSVSAARIANVLYDIAHDPVNPTPIIASIHQPRQALHPVYIDLQADTTLFSSQLYQKFDLVVLLSHGRSLYSGPGGFAPAEHFATVSPDTVAPYQQGYNVAEYLLEVANDPHVSLFQIQTTSLQAATPSASGDDELHKTSSESQPQIILSEKGSTAHLGGSRKRIFSSNNFSRSVYPTTFLTQLQHLCGREWKILKRDKSLFLTHVVVASILGVFCGGLYFNTGITIAGFQSRVGCLFFLGALIAFSSLSALHNMVEIRPLFLRERSSGYYSPTAWLLSRFFFDMIPLRLIPTIIVGSITYWMANLAPNAANFFKFLLILVLYSLAMTLFNFLLGTLFENGGIAILLSALSALYQMTFAGFFVHLSEIPPVLRWLQWLCPLKYTLEALSVNEVDSGLMIQDTLQGVPVNISASLIMNLLFGFGLNNYYRDVLIHVAFIGGFGIGVIGVVWFKSELSCGPEAVRSISGLHSEHQREGVSNFAMQIIKRIELDEYFTYLNKDRNALGPGNIDVAVESLQAFIDLVNKISENVWRDERGSSVNQSGVTFMVGITGQGIYDVELKFTSPEFLSTFYALIKHLYDPGHFKDDRYEVGFNNRTQKFEYTLSLTLKPGTTPTKQGGFQAIYASNPFGTTTYVFAMDDSMDPLMINRQPLRVVKDQYCRNTRFTEPEILKHIQNTPGVVTLLHDEEWNTPVHFEHRIKRRLGLLQHGEQFMHIRTLRGMLEVSYDALEVTRYLRTKRNVLHRDLSIGNIMVVWNRTNDSNKVDEDPNEPEICFVKHLLGESDNPQQTSVVLIDFNRAERLDVDPRQPRNDRTGTPLFIARAVQNNGPYPDLPARRLVMVPAMPSAPMIYQQYLPTRAKYFDQDKMKEYTLEQDKMNTTERVWRHELYHEAESIFWIMLYWLMVANADYGDKHAAERIGSTVWNLFTSTVDCEDRGVLLDSLVSKAIKASNIVHSKFFPTVNDLIRPLAEAISTGPYYLPDHESTGDLRTHIEFAHEAFQRIILNFIIAHKDDEFMKHETNVESPRGFTTNILLRHTVPSRLFTSSSQFHTNSKGTRSSQHLTGSKGTTGSQSHTNSKRASPLPEENEGPYLLESQSKKPRRDGP
ncbi:ABC transporter G family member [Psilocybe cubensis]|uniref:ABC transporter G family member n=2 Tax=Psilocybe cubensis TaxID=181762 RepID=A0ACB8H6W5_PSICU|nr:ABC transporter G family member [Psilocybe cubensis]KAH9483668.1 ABC transporter G family member [Psilocybe cubensis]